MRAVLLLLWAACVVACSSLRKEQLQTTNSLNEKQQIQSYFVHTRYWSLATHDSSSTETYWRIWPKGSISFSKDSGFKGEATLVEMQRKESNNRNSQANGKDSTRLHQTLNAERDSKLTATTKVREGFNNWRLITGVALAALVIWWLLWKRLRS